MAKIIFLGTAAAVATAQRDNTSLLIIEGKDKILIDCPGSLVSKFRKINIDYRKTNCIFLSHAHPDHIYGIVSLIHSRYQLYDKIKIYSHPDTLNIVKRLRKIFKLENEAKYPKLYYKAIGPNLKKPFYDSKETAVWAFPVRHAPESLGFKFLFKKSRITCVFSSDTAESPNIINYAKDCDYLIYDCFSPYRFFKKYPQLNKMHTSSISLGKIAKKVGTKILIPIHFAGEVNYSFDTIVKEIRKEFKGKIIIPKDLETLRLTSRLS